MHQPWQWHILYVQQQALRVFEIFLDAHEERDRFTAVDETVIVGQGKVHHRTDLDPVVDGYGPRLNLVHAENARLRRIEDRGRHQRTEHAAVRDREGAALQLFEPELAVARP